MGQKYNVIIMFLATNNLVLNLLDVYDFPQVFLDLRRFSDEIGRLNCVNRRDQKYMHV